MSMHPAHAAWFACVAAGATVAAAAVAAALVRGSTAVPAAVWAAVAGVALMIEQAVRAGGGLSDPALASAVRLGVVALSVCPLMSLLGAKRPQHGVWQFIVATLAAVLAMPAASAALVRPGSFPDVHMLERALLLLLILIAWANFAGTRRLGAATLVAVGQAVLARDFLPLVPRVEGPLAAWLDPAGCAAVAAGALVAAAQAIVSQRKRAAAQPRQTAWRVDAPPFAAVDTSFLALRETLGAAWILRIAERFNTVAAERGWPCRLSFTGVDVGGDPADTGWHRDAQRAYVALMRRFVTADWLRRHGQIPVARAANGG